MVNDRNQTQSGAALLQQEGNSSSIEVSSIAQKWTKDDRSKFYFTEL
jgi:hypothetical protein